MHMFLTLKHEGFTRVSMHMVIPPAQVLFHLHIEFHMHLSYTIPSFLDYFEKVGSAAQALNDKWVLRALFHHSFT